MFDISFAELMMIAIVGLLVIGPEKLPKVARTLGAYTGRLQRYVSQVKEEVNREVRFEELQALQEEIKEGANQVKSSILGGVNDVEETVASVTEEVKPKRKASGKKTTTVTRKTAGTKTTSKKAQAKRTAPQKSTVKKSTVKKPAVRKATAKKSSAQKGESKAKA